MTTAERIAKHLDRAEKNQREGMQMQRDTVRMISALHDRIKDGAQEAREAHAQMMKESAARHAEIMARLNGKV